MIDMNIVFPGWLERLSESLKTSVEEGMPSEYASLVIETIVAKALENGEIEVR